MLQYIIRRLLTITPILLGVTLAVFFLTTLIPGDVVDILLDIDAEPEVAARLRSIMGLDKPFAVRYWNWVSNLATGDFGLSVVNGRPVITLIA